jgi:hypothetical protein
MLRWPIVSAKIELEEIIGYAALAERRGFASWA